MKLIPLKSIVNFIGICMVSTAFYAQDQTDILIVGGGTGGTAAAIQAARSGAAVTVLEPTAWLGGMLTAAGVSAIDGNHQMPSGIWGEFRDSLYQRYGGPKQVATGWVSHTLFEPAIGQQILTNMVRHPNIQLHRNTMLTQVVHKDGLWHTTALKGKQKIEITAQILIDGTERGDLLELLNIPYRTGMDSREETGEIWAPETRADIVQDLTVVAVLEDAGNSRSKRGLVSKPKNYNPSDFECACKREAGDMFGAISDCDQMLNYAKTPGNKYIINWPNCGNDYYLNWPNMSDAARSKALELAREHTLAFVYYIQQELGYKNLRLSSEFPTSDGLALIPYDRESRRLKGRIFLTANHLASPYNFTLYRTGIAVGDYPIDHHHDKNPEAPEIDFISIKVPSYNIPLGALIPEQQSNFIVAEKNISVSNIANGTTRLQPVVLGVGQAAGALAALSVRNSASPEEIPVRQVQEELLKYHAFLMPYLDVDRFDPAFEAIQRIGACGIIKGVGIPYKWANETWFYPEHLISEYELKTGLTEWYPEVRGFAASGKPLTPKSLTQMLLTIDPSLELDSQVALGEEIIDLSNPNTPLTRKIVSVLLDQKLHPFSIPIDHLGNPKTE